MSWYHGILGKDAATKLAVDSTHFAARFAGRPMHLGANGAAFALSFTSGIMAAGMAANAEIIQMRWIHATFKCLLRSIVVNIYRASATAFTAGTVNVTATHARGWSVDGGAGLPIVFSTFNTNKKRTDFNLSKFSDTGVRRSDTAALTAGTKQLDTNPFASLGGFVGAVAPAATVEVAPSIIGPGTYLWQRNTHEEYPVLYEQNEGLVIRATVPATGTWGFAIGVEWAEIDPAEVDGWA
jgi:hypothetical protein